LDIALEQTDNSITPTAQDYERYKSRASEIAGLLLRSGAATECHLVGSVSRSTAIKKISDVDLVAVMAADGENAIQHPRTLIARLAEVLSGSAADITSGAVAASLRFDDPPYVDVIPAIKSAGSYAYLIPDERGDTWRQFEPEILENLIASLGRRLGPRFRTLVRLIKYWNQLRRVGLRSSDLEELACAAMRDAAEISSYPDAIAQVLNFVAGWVEGDRYAEEVMGRPFLPDELNDRARDIARESKRAARVITQSRAEAEATILKEFFGGTVTENPY
jgi:predicted nucleotidyltransferase